MFARRGVSVRALGTIADGAVSVKSAQAFRGARLSRQRFGPADFGRWLPPFVGHDPKALRNRVPESARWDLRAEVPLHPAAGRTLWDVVHETTEAMPHKEVLHALHTREKLKWDWSKFLYETEGYGNGFVDNGMVGGAKAVAWLGNEVELAVSFFASAYSGATVLAVDPNASAEAVREVMLDESPRMLLFHQRWGAADRLSEVATSVIPELPDPRNAMAPGASLHSKVFPKLHHVVNTGFGLDAAGRIKGFYQFTAPDEGAEALGGLPTSCALARAYVGGDAPLWQSITMGSDGSLQKGQLRTQEDCLNVANSFVSTTGIDENDRVVVTAPLHTELGMLGGVLGSVTAKSLFAVVAREFDAKKTLDALTKAKATVLVATAEQLQQLQEELQRNPGHTDTRFLRTTVTDSAVQTKLGQEDNLTIN